MSAVVQGHVRSGLYHHDRWWLTAFRVDTRRAADVVRKRLVGNQNGIRRGTRPVFKKTVFMFRQYSIIIVIRGRARRIVISRDEPADA